MDRIQRTILPVIALGLAFVLSSCGGLKPIQPPDPAFVGAPATGEVYQLTPGDTVTVDIFRRSDLKSILALEDIELDETGAIVLPMAGSVKVGGLTLEEAGRRVQDKLADKMVNPEVAINITNAHGRRFYVLGEVVKPGVYTAKANVTLIEGVLLAGGFTVDAEEDSIVVVRKGPERRVQGDIEELLSDADFHFNIALRPMDIVYVPPNGIARTERFVGHVTKILQPFIDVSSVVVLSSAVK